jgi:hypothetical protein
MLIRREEEVGGASDCRAWYDSMTKAVKTAENRPAYWHYEQRGQIRNMLLTKTKRVSISSRYSLCICSSCRLSSTYAASQA